MKEDPASADRAFAAHHTDGQHAPVFVAFDQLPAYGVPKFSRVHIIRLQRLGKFPQQVQITANRVGWTLDSIQDWVASRPLSSKVAPEAPDAAD
jgi:hypothetical protein